MPTIYPIDERGSGSGGTGGSIPGPDDGGLDYGERVKKLPAEKVIQTDDLQFVSQIDKNRWNATAHLVLDDPEQLVNMLWPFILALLPSGSGGTGGTVTIWQHEGTLTSTDNIFIDLPTGKRISDITAKSKLVIAMHGVILVETDFNIITPSRIQIVNPAYQVDGMAYHIVYIA